MTRSKRKAIIFCENNTLADDVIVCLRVIKNGKRYTFNCTPYQALNHMMFSKFVWFDSHPHI